MKRVKIMLLSLAVLAVAGGVLAFKAKGPHYWCTSLAILSQNGAYTCPTGLTCPVDANVTTVVPVGTPFYCTTPTSGDAIDPCNTIKQATLICGTPARTLKKD